MTLLSESIHNTSSSDLFLSPEEWKTVLKLAKAHNVLPLVFERASEHTSFTELQPYPKYAVSAMRIVATQAKQTEVFLTLYKSFLRSDLHPIVMKGVICRQLYGERSDYRPSGDEDILIQKSEFELVKEVLINNGFIPESEKITAGQLEELQEVTFYHPNPNLAIEVHLNPIGHENSWRQQFDDCFKNVFQDYREENIHGISIRTMNHTDHLLFLVLHAFKHLTVGGFGIRQVTDILMYIERYGTKCDWRYLNEMISRLKADSFLGDIVYIGNQYLGFHLETDTKINCPNELLEEILSCGAFGNATQSQRTAAQMTSAAVSGRGSNGEAKLKTMLYTVFPSRAWLLGAHPELQEKPWLLPVRWVQRWKRFLVHNKQNGGNLAFESIQISKRRIELLEKYGIL